MTQSIDNKFISSQINLLAKMMELHDENPFKIKNYTFAAQLIKKLPEDLATLSEEQLRSIQGIGNASTAKIAEIIQTGTITELDKLLEKTPAGVVDMLQIKGLGAKKVAILWKEMSIESIGELEYACTENRLIPFKGFGPKTQENILKNIAFIKSNTGYYLWADAEEIKTQSTKNYFSHFPEHTFVITGDFIQQLPTLNVLVWITDCPLEKISQHFNNTEETVTIENNGNVLIVSFPDSITQEFHFTPEENIVREAFLLSGEETFITAFTEKYTIENAAVKEDIFTQNHIAYIPPPLRYGTEIIEQAAQNNIPQLIDEKDIIGIIHCHSTWSDGVNTIEQMAKEAVKRGCEFMVISDHSQSTYYANGLKVPQIEAQHEEINRLNEQLRPFKIFKSIESDILNDGALDYEPEVLAKFDLVIASVHSNLNMSKEKAMQRVLTAIQNPYTTILGHPSGRLLLSREGYPLDYYKLTDACAAHNVAIEINAHPRRLDIDWQWIPYALSKNVLLSVNPDAHSTAGIQVLKYGIAAAQKGGLTKAHNLSSYSLETFEAFLENQKKKRTTP